MKVRPINFRDDMVRATKDGKKTQTRRPVKWPLKGRSDGNKSRIWTESDADEIAIRLAQPQPRHTHHRVPCPYGQPGDRLRVKGGITLEIAAVRIERVQDISMADAMAEGGPPSHESIDSVSRSLGFKDFPRSWFAQTWDSFYETTDYAWAANPFVWVVEFEVAK